MMADTSSGLQRSSRDPIISEAEGANLGIATHTDASRAWLGCDRGTNWRSGMLYK
jgi:hypothetical protein